MDMHNILIAPIITEKAMSEAGKGKFTFAVQKAASKNAIRNAIAKVFNVTVTGVQTTTVKGKRKKIGQKRTEVNDSVWKKAIVTLKKGEKIAIFEAAA